jgi:hypothetical protein
VEGLTIGPDEFANLLTELRKTNVLLAQRHESASDWKIALRNGLMFGVGSAIGASVLVAILLSILKPLERIEAIKDPIERLATELQHRK